MVAAAEPGAEDRAATTRPGVPVENFERRGQVPFEPVQRLVERARVVQREGERLLLAARPRPVHGELLDHLRCGIQFQLGGFEPLASSEDVALVRALQAVGARIAWSAAPRVVTSARSVFRAPGGFGASLLRASEASASDTETAS